MLALFLACQPRPAITVYSSTHLEALQAYLDHIPSDGKLRLTETEAPERKARFGRGFRIALVEDLDCTECFEIEGEDRSWTVHHGDLLGAQYGLTDVLEGMGLRFLHPQDPFVPDLDPYAEGEQVLAAPTGLAGLQAPEMARRGLHLHTLHPIEGYFDFWDPGDDNLQRAKGVIDWAVKNRANHLQWVALDDITSPSAHADWVAHTRAIQDYAALRGITTGLGIQLFSGANLQQAYDLIDDPDSDLVPQLEERIARLTDELDFDVLNLSFGEFSGEAPETFLEAANQAMAVIQTFEPGVDVPTVVHVGDDVRVEYAGEEMIYYFLITFADERYRPWIHTVMFYNLFDDAGGAYHHDTFDEHRAYLEDALLAEEPVGYFPETAYWVAFDSPVPQYLPLYSYSRWRDIDQLATFASDHGVPGLQDHVLFSSGWEWGYWQHDRSTLRHSYRRDDDWAVWLKHDFAPWGDPGTALAERLEELAELQHEALIESRLAAYTSGRDSTMELGYGLGIVSQPKAVLFDELAETDLDAFRADVLEPLDAYATEAEALATAVDELDLSDDRWMHESTQGFQITALRARFVHEVYSAAVTSVEGDAGDLDTARALLADAQEVVASRHADLHDPDPSRLLEEGDNATIYQYGYLIRADELCFWERELVQAGNVIHGTGDTAPACAL